MVVVTFAKKSLSRFLVIKAYYAILFFLCLGVKPFYTVGYVAYYELNIDYIVEKYCVNKSKSKFKCNGKCHLAKKLSFSSNIDLDNSKQAIFNSIHEAFFPVFHQELTAEFNLVKQCDFKQVHWLFAPKKYTVFPSITSPPPQC